MNTIVNKTNQSQLASIPAGQYNNSVSSLILFGKNFANYGEALNENMVHMMEHFANNVPPVNPLSGQLWYDTISKQLKIYDNGWTLVNSNSIQGIADAVVKNRIYVSKSGNDANTGLSWYNAKLTIGAAVAEAANQIALGNFTPEHTAVLVASGEYVEPQCPIVIPAGVSLIGDNLRSVTVRPPASNPYIDVFYLNSKCYVYGITVRGHQLNPSALDITPTGYAGASGRNLPINTPQVGFAFGFAPGADILVSPYIQNCSSISGDPDTGSGLTPGGGGVLVDGNIISPNSRVHSIVVDAFTQINLGGIGVKVVGKGYMQLVSFFTNFCQFGLLTVDGGHVTALNSNCSFGNYSLWAEGSRVLDNATSVYYTWTSANSTIDGANITFTTPVGQVLLNSQLKDLQVTLNNVIQTYGLDYTVVVDTVAKTTSIVFLGYPPAVGSTITASVQFGSLVEASGYTMSYAGAGLNYTELSPSQGGVGESDPNKYTIARNGGRIYHTTTDESGNFYVGLLKPGAVDSTTGIQSAAIPSFRINQRSGTIDGRSFYQSIFGFMTPFILALTRKGL